MLLPNQKVLVNKAHDPFDPLVAIDKEFIVTFASGTEDENPSDDFCVYFGGKTLAAGTLDAQVLNLPVQTQPALAVADGSDIASMTQLAAPGSKNELKFCEFTGGRIRVKVTPGGAPQASVSVVLMANRPFNVTEYTP